MIAFKDFIQTLRTELWPANEPKTLRVAHSKYFQVAMIQMQRDFEVLQANNISVFPFLSTYFDCGKTMVGCPWGIINRVYTIANNNWCDRVYYEQGTYEDVMAWARNLTVTTPANTGFPELPQAIKYSQASTDLTVGNKSARARVGLYCIHNKRLYVVPYLQSNESIVVEWDGIRTDWKDDDAVDPAYWHEQAQELVKCHVEYHHEKRWGTPQMAARAMGDIDRIRAELLYDESRNTWVKQPIPQQLSGSYLPTSTQIDDQAVPAVNDTVEFAVMSDSGTDDSNQDAVATLLENDVKDFLIIAGDVSIGSAAYADVVTAKYPGQAVILPSRGDRDYDFDSGTPYEEFFTDLGMDGVRYEYVNGPAHFFFLPSDPRESFLLGYVDATTSTEDGPTGQWLRAKLALSPAIWKFIVFHHTSKSSGSTNGSALWMDWDFAAMGLAGKVDGIFMGHNNNFEVVKVNGIRYFTVGTGGSALNGFGAPVTGSEFRSQSFGALFNSVTETEWSYEFRNPAGTVLHSETVSK